MPDKQKPKSGRVRICPACKGTGLDKSLHRRYTSGGRNDRRCRVCDGQCYLEAQEDREAPS